MEVRNIKFHKNVSSRTDRQTGSIHDKSVVDLQYGVFGYFHYGRRLFFVALFNGPLKQKALMVEIVGRDVWVSAYVAYSYTTHQLRYMRSTVSHLGATRWYFDLDKV